MTASATQRKGRGKGPVLTQAEQYAVGRQMRDLAVKGDVQAGLVLALMTLNRTLQRQQSDKKNEYISTSGKD